MFPKSKRKEDKKLLAAVRKKPCLVCGKVPSDPDHIVTRGAGGGDDVWNVGPLGRRHHNERHRNGLAAMTWKYHGPLEWLEANGWTFCETRKRWGRE